MTLSQTYPYLRLNERELLARVVLNASDAARVCGITTRQLTYWTDKGIIPCVEGENRAYRAEALARAVQIRRAMENGYTLEKAAEMVGLRQAEKESRSPRYGELADTALVQELDRYLMRLEKNLAAFQSRLPMYVVLCKLMDLVAEVQRVSAQRLLDESPFDNRSSDELAARLDSALAEVQRLLAEMAGPVLVA